MGGKVTESNNFLTKNHPYKENEKDNHSYKFSNKNRRQNSRFILKNVTINY